MKKPRPRRAEPWAGAIVKLPKGRYVVKRHDKDREKSGKPIIPYFFLDCVGFSLYPDA